MPEGKANVPLETNVNFKDLGDDFEGVKEGFVDYLFRGVNLVLCSRN